MYTITKNNEAIISYENLFDAQIGFAGVVANDCNLIVSSTFFDDVVIADDEGLILWTKNDNNYYFMYNDNEYEIKQTNF